MPELDLSESDKVSHPSSDWLLQFRIPIAIALIGAIFIGIGALVFFWPEGNSDKIEIITTSPTIPANSSGSRVGETDKTIWVDITGAIEKPGVYELNPGSRVNDLLITAGGITADANRDWIDLHLNRAQILSDGIKIYIPFAKDQNPPATLNLSTQGTVSASSTININTASKTQLESLWGIGPVTADKIITSRPFSRPEELLEKKIVKSNVYDRIKDLISVY